VDLELAKKLLSGDEQGEEWLEGAMEKTDAELPVTQSDDPRSGGHFALGMSKPPLGPTRERSGVVHVGALHMAHRDYPRPGVNTESPISNGLTTVAEREA